MYLFPWKAGASLPPGGNGRPAADARAVRTRRPLFDTPSPGFRQQQGALLVLIKSYSEIALRYVTNDNISAHKMHIYVIIALLLFIFYYPRG